MRIALLIALFLVACGHPVRELDSCDPSERGMTFCSDGVVYLCEPSVAICVEGDDGMGGCAKYETRYDVWVRNDLCR